MFDALSCDIAILALRVKEFLSTGHLHTLKMGMFFYDAWVLMAAGVKWAFSLIGVELDPVHIFQILDITSFFIGLYFLYRLFAQRAGIITIIFSLLFAISAPGALPTAILGHGHAFVFMLLAMFVSIIEGITIDEDRKFLMRIVRVIFLFAFLIFIIRPQDGVFLLLPMSILAGERLGVFSWPRKKLLRSLIPITFLGLFLLLLFLFTNNVGLSRLVANFAGMKMRWFAIAGMCIVYGLGFLSIGLYPFLKTRRHWLPAWVYLLTVILATILLRIKFEFRFVFPLIAFVIPAVISSMDILLRKIKPLFILFMFIIFTAVFLFQSKQVIDYMVYRYLKLNRNFVNSIVGLNNADVIIAEDLGPLFRYYSGKEIIYPKTFMTPKEMFYFWGKIDELIRKGKKILYLSTVVNYQHRQLLPYLLLNMYPEFIYSGYILDWHGCHGIIPSLQPVVVWEIKERNLSAALPHTDNP